MDNLLLSLWITLLGMGLVFLAILLLWGLMALLTAVLPRLERKRAQAADEEALRAQAAAAAVAVALAHQRQSGARPFPMPPTAIVSAWQLSRRGENLNKQGNVR